MLHSYSNYFLAAFTSLFTIVNPLGMMPVFLGLTAADTSEYRKWQAKKACLYMACILAFFLFAGTFIMNFFGISLESLRIAGGLVILRSGLSMLNSDDRLSKKSKLEAIEKPDISLTPLAMPLLSGPGSIAATISLATQSPEIIHNLIVLLSIILVGVIAYLILRVSNTLLPWIGRGGLEAVTKIMGFIAMTVGVQFFINGITPLIEDLMK
jgi:multiple antibiotic resistance protein